MTERILECDLGNTSCAWRLMSATGELDRGLAEFADGFAALRLPAGIARVRVASVARSEITQALLDKLGGVGLKPELAKTQRSAVGVLNAYGEDYARLGIDRWLAILAAHVGYGAALIIDAGSALTADMVDAEGRHWGGYIVPGVDLMKKSLLVDTGHVRFDDQDAMTGLQFGSSTAGSVMAGIMAAQVGAALQAVSQVEKHYKKDFAILVTGGAAQSIMAFLPKRAILLPDLVLDGLSLALP